MPPAATGGIHISKLTKAWLRDLQTFQSLSHIRIDLHGAVGLIIVTHHHRLPIGKNARRIGSVANPVSEREGFSADVAYPNLHHSFIIEDDWDSVVARGLGLNKIKRRSFAGGEVLEEKIFPAFLEICKIHRVVDMPQRIQIGEADLDRKNVRFS